MATTTFSLKELEDDPRLFLYTSLTAGSSHITTATSRMETILKANRIPFQAIDIATDEKARRLWQRRAKDRKLPGLVKEGFVIGDLNEVEEWNEFGELKEAIGPVPANNAAPPGGQVGVNIAPPSLPVIPTATAGTTIIKKPAVDKDSQPGFDKSKAVRLPGAEEIAARQKEKAAATAAEREKEKAAAAAATITSSAPPTATLDALSPETLTSSADDKKQSIETAKEAAASQSSEVAVDATTSKEEAAKEKKTTKHITIADPPSKEAMAGKTGSTSRIEPTSKTDPTSKTEPSVKAEPASTTHSKPEAQEEDQEEQEPTRASPSASEAAADKPSIPSQSHAGTKPETTTKTAAEGVTTTGPSTGGAEEADVQKEENEGVGEQQKPKTQEQDPTEPADAAKSVED